MKPVIRSLTLKGFRSVANERIELDNPTFLVGVNGSGKSNVLDAFAFLADAMRAPLPEVIAKRKGADALFYQTGAPRSRLSFGLRVDFGRTSKIRSGSYSLEIKALGNRGFEVVREQCRFTDAKGRLHWFDRKRDSFTSSVSSDPFSLEPDWLALRYVGGQKVFAPIFRLLLLMEVYSIDPAALRERGRGPGGPRLGGDGANTADILEDLKEWSPAKLQEIDEFLSVLMPIEVHVRTVPQEDDDLVLEFDQRVSQHRLVTLKAASMPEGALRVLGLLAATFQRTPLSLMAIEEPETSVHPDGLGVVLDVLELAARRSQVIVTTHSPELLQAKWIKGRHLRSVVWHHGTTRVIPISEASRKALEEGIMGAGEMLRSNLLDPSQARIDEGPSNLELFEDLA
jgi:predicted ATPase